MIIQDLYESPQLCPECGGISFSDLILAEKKDACYYKVKASAKVWPSAYASGRLVQCRKKGADNYGKSKNESVAEGSESDAYGNTGEKHECGSCDGTGIVSYDELAKAAEYDDVCPECGGKGWVRDKESLKKKGVAEGFPHDVDHMPGPVIRNADMTTDNAKTKDKAEWDRATDSINARVFDDMSEFRTDSKGETVVGDSAVWAKWDNATQTGWFNAKGRPLKPWPVKEQGMAEEQLDEKCWDGYQQQGMKNKGGRQVPNCVPAESVNEMDKSQTPPGRDGSNDSDAGKKEYTAKATTPEKVAKDAEKILNKELNKKKGMAEGINPDITNPEFSHQQQIGDYLYVARYWSKGLKITAYDGAKKIGYAELMYQSAPFDDFADPKTTPKRIWLESEWTHVDPKYQRQGIMGTMYAYAKMLGNSVKPSQTRSDDAKAAWKSWRDAGDAQHLTREGVAEDQLAEKSTSQAQFRTMAAAAHNPKFAKKVGISPAVAKEFHGADRKQDYTDLPKKADESKSAPKEKEADYGDDYQDMVARVKKLAGLGPLKTVYDPQKRVYRNIPTAQQPKK